MMWNLLTMLILLMIYKPTNDNVIPVDEIAKPIGEAVKPNDKTVKLNYETANQMINCQT